LSIAVNASLKSSGARTPSAWTVIPIDSATCADPLHLTMEMLKTSAGIELQAVPHRGDAPLNAALIVGEIQAGVVPMATTLPHLQNDLLKALAVGGAQRAAALPTQD
jgi:tripartite-type tricarboxylate transporter receptor subunit TctC